MKVLGRIVQLKRQVWCPVQLGFSQIHSSSALGAGKIWRQKHGLPKLQTSKGALIDLPDYSFIDGRPVPLSVGQAKRKELQKNLATDIINGLKFLEKAKEASKNT